MATNSGQVQNNLPIIPSTFTYNSHIPLQMPYQQQPYNQPQQGAYQQGPPVMYIPNQAAYPNQIMYQPINNQPIINQPINNQPIINQPINNQPINNQPIINQPINNQPIINQPIIHQPQSQQMIYHQSQNPNAQQLVVVATPTTIKRCRYNQDIKHTNQCMIMGQIVKSLKTNNIQEVDIDLVPLAVALSNLIPRMTKTVMEIIVDYHFSNPEAIQIMGRRDGAPYGGHYDGANTNLDLKKLPDSLLIILHEFILLTKTHSAK